MNECVGERTGQQRIIPTEPHIAPLPSGYILTKCGDTAYVDALAPRLGSCCPVICGTFVTRAEFRAPWPTPTADSAPWKHQASTHAVNTQLK